MLPPPMTMAVSTPSPCSSPTSRAIRVTTAGIDAELLLAHQGFARQLEEDAFVDGAWDDAESAGIDQRLYRCVTWPPRRGVPAPTLLRSFAARSPATRRRVPEAMSMFDDDHDGASGPTRVPEGVGAVCRGGRPGVGASGPGAGTAAEAGARRRARRRTRPAEEEAAARQGRPRIPRLRHVRRQHVQAGEDLDLRAVRVQLRGIASRDVGRSRLPSTAVLQQLDQSGHDAALRARSAVSASSTSAHLIQQLRRGRRRRAPSSACSRSAPCGARRRPARPASAPARRRCRGVRAGSRAEPRLVGVARVGEPALQEQHVAQVVVAEDERRAPGR